MTSVILHEPAEAFQQRMRWRLLPLLRAVRHMSLEALVAATAVLL
jgi:hypothetical protein